MATKRKADYTPEEWEARKAYNRRKSMEFYRRKVASIPNYARDLSRKRMDKIYADPDRHKKFLETERERIRKKKENNPNYARDKARKTKARIYADPVLYAKWLAWNREYYRRKHGSAKIEQDDCAAQMRKGLRDDVLYSSVWACLPERLQIDIKEDIASEAIVLILTGEASTPAEAVKMGRKALNRATSSFGTISLDQPRYDGRSWHDTLTDDAPRAGYAA